jgi:hypothetical protein
MQTTRNIKAIISSIFFLKKETKLIPGIKKIMRLISKERNSSGKGTK